MKNYIVRLALLSGLIPCLSILLSVPSYGQQWSGNSNTTDDISRTGKVGIGTVSPSKKLHVDIGSSAEDGIQISSAATGTRPGLRISNTAETLSMSMTADGTNDHASLSFGAGSAWGYLYMPTNDASVHLTTTGNDNTVRLGPTSHFKGSVGIGTTSPSNKLDVKGKVRAEEVIVETGWADFVFEDGYDLRSLQEVETYIDEHGHLPEIPSAEEIETNGVRLGEIQAKLLQKIEEVTLYLIEMNKENQALRQEVRLLKQGTE